MIKQKTRYYYKNCEYMLDVNNNIINKNALIFLTPPKIWTLLKPFEIQTA